LGTNEDPSSELDYLLWLDPLCCCWRFCSRPLVEEQFVQRTRKYCIFFSGVSSMTNETDARSKMYRMYYYESVTLVCGLGPSPWPWFLKFLASTLALIPQVLGLWSQVLVHIPLINRQVRLYSQRVPFYLI